MSQPVTRPRLELGPMTGDEDYVRKRVQGLISIFEPLLQKDLELREGPYGCTDCETFIQVNTTEYDAYLVGEHEISHPLFGTDLQLTKDFEKTAVERLLRKSGKAATHPSVSHYRGRMQEIIHSLWNGLEDHRCWGLWTELYPGGGGLLRKRWDNLAEFEKEEDAKKCLTSYCMRLASGFHTAGAPPEFHRCGPIYLKHNRMVEGVDAEACLAITARMVDEMADELEKIIDPKDEPNKGVRRVMGMLKSNPTDSSGNGNDNSLGAPDLADPPKPKKTTARRMLRIRRMVTAGTAVNEDGESQLDAMIDSGIERMNERLEEARRAMSVPNASTQKKAESKLLGVGKICGIKSRFVDPVHPLPKPSRTARKTQEYLRRVAMRRRTILADEGDEIDVDAYIDAMKGGELGVAKIFSSQRLEAGLELLILIDASGSMLGPGMAIVDQALADIKCSCKSLKVKLHFWAFSSELFFLRKLESPRNARGLTHMLTSMVQALDVAAEWAKIARSTRAVILVTDGYPTSCRGRNSSGDAIKDLRSVLDEMRRAGIVCSVLAVGGSPGSFDGAFGEKKYAHVSILQELEKALPKCCKVLVEAHIQKRRR